MQWRWQDVPGALAAWAVALCALLVIVNPAPLLRVALAVLTPVVVLLAFLANLQQGICPSCRASRRHQRRQVGEPSVRASSRTNSSSAGVGVATGWDVEVPVDHLCDRCGRQRRVVSTCFVERQQAATAAEAKLIAVRDLD
jgi:hypothetical protein